MRFLVPKFLRKIDNHLLYRAPQLWITKIHYAVPGALVIAVSLYLITLAFGYNIENDLPDQWDSFGLLLLPALTIFFYWFVIQAQYNVDKNYGRLSLGHDYQNFFSYLIIIFSFFTVMVSIPTGQMTNVDRAVSDEELKEDIRTLNRGYAYFNGDYSVRTYKSDEPGEYRPAVFNVEPTEYIDLGYWYDHEYEWSEILQEPVYKEQRQVAYEQAEEEIMAFQKVYNKYTPFDIHWNPEKILGISGHYDEGTDEFYYDNHSRFNINWNVGSKIEKIWRVKFDLGNFYMSIYDYEFLMVMFAIIGYLALLTWMFKNVHWKNYVAAGITVIVTPLFMGITGLILFEVIDISYQIEEEVILGVIVVLNLITLLFGILPMLRKRYSSFGVICMLLLQFWMPALIMIYGMIGVEIWRDGYYDYYSDYNWEYISEVRAWMAQILYYGGWIFMIASIALFKKYYAYMWAFPKSK